MKKILFGKKLLGALLCAVMIGGIVPVWPRSMTAAKAEDATMITADPTELTGSMESFGVTIEKAMDSLKIPQSQRSTYAGLVGKKTR